MVSAPVGRGCSTRSRRRVLQSLGALGSVAGLPALWAALGATAPPARAGTLQLAPLPLRQRRLANGLRVVGLAGGPTATVSVQVWYQVGGKDDPEGRSGFAHLFEHMMFKGTRHMRDEMFDRLTEDVGGQNNAFTAEDMTVYQSEVPSNHLERLLWAEAERMAHLRVDQASFDSERKVVIEELHERVRADPYGALFHALPGHAFAEHPYRHPVIGSETDLMAATLDDVQQFHARYYRPDNAVLVVAGDVDMAELDRWVDRYFGGLPVPAGPVPRVQRLEPPRRRDARATLTAPNVPLPAVALLWQGPPAAHADAPALQVAQALLASGDSSRLNEVLVYRDQIAIGAGFSAELFADAGMLVAYGFAASGQTLERLESALLAELRRLADGPLPAAELDKVRTQLLTGVLMSRQTPHGQADAIGRAVLVHGDATAADSQIARLQAVRADDVQRVLRRHVLGANRVTLAYRQASGLSAAGGAR
jgi:zinc protease